MKVLKFGGTSVGSVARLRALPALLPNDVPHIVVLSAMAGTTNALVQIAQLLTTGQPAAAATQLDALRRHYHAVAEELLAGTAAVAATLAALDACFDAVGALAAQPLTPVGERVILAQGELLSTLLFHRYLTDVLGQPAVLLPALDFMRLDAQAEPAADYIETQLTDLLSAHAGCQRFITQGYICRDAEGSIANLRRGGSDYSASLIGAAIKASEIQIWTDIDGLHNNDPRVVAETYPVRELSFDEAAELAYFGAKILHPSSVLPARQHGIPVRLLNTMEPEAPGTLISTRTGPAGIKAVSVKDGLVAIRVQSSRRLVAYDFLPRVFEAFRRHRTAIDMVTTSETGVSLTIDDATSLPAILPELRELGEVAVTTGHSLVCVVGRQLVQEHYGLTCSIFSALRGLPLHMICYGGSANNVSFLIDTADKVRALRALHETVFQPWMQPSHLLLAAEEQLAKMLA